LQTCGSRKKRDVSSPDDDDTDNVFSYGPIHVHSNKPSCSRVRQSFLCELHLNYLLYFMEMNLALTSNNNNKRF